MIESSLYVEGRAEGLAQGRLEAERDICAELVRKYHAAVAPRALSLVHSCSDAAQLKEWALAAPDLSDSDFLRLLGA